MLGISTPRLAALGAGVAPSGSSVDRDVGLISRHSMGVFRGFDWVEILAERCKSRKDG